MTQAAEAQAGEPRVSAPPGVSASEWRLACGCEGFGVTRCDEYVRLWNAHRVAHADWKRAGEDYCHAGCSSDALFDRMRSAQVARDEAWRALCAHLGEEV